MKGLCGLLLAAVLATAPVALADTSGTATVTGTVLDASTGAPVAGVDAVTSDGTYTYSNPTDSSGNFTLTGLPPGSYTISFIPPDGYQRTSVGPITLTAGETDQLGTIEIAPQGSGSVTGRVTDPSGAGLPAAQVQLLSSAGIPETAVSGAGGRYAISDVPSGTYTVTVTPGDAGGTIGLGSTTVTGNATTTDNLRLPAPPVPAGTAPRHATRDLAWLNAERVANGLPGGILLNNRWATDCAAHDAYQRANHVETHFEIAGRPRFSAGGAWAGKNSVISPVAWTRSANPWEPAPLHLDQLYAPSLSVVGIDDSRGWVCTTTWPGMLRTFAGDTVFTYPGNGVRHVPTSENAHENPFVPGQFVGIPQYALTGRELFVYLNRAGAAGQARVKFVSASLSGPHGRVAIRTVDNSTPTVGQYLAGGIIIPVKPLAPRTTYTGSVIVTDGSKTITHTWHFTTAPNPATKRRHRR
jgi:hypothetical protein